MKRCAVLFMLPVLVACSSEKTSLADVSLGTGALLVVSKASYLKPEYLGAALIVYGLYDPDAPNWEVQVGNMNEDGSNVRIAMRMKAFHSGGDGEAHQVFREAVERLMQQRGFSGYQIVAYEEGIESVRPLAQRVARGEVHMRRSQIWPEL